MLFRYEDIQIQIWKADISLSFFKQLLLTICKSAGCENRQTENICDMQSLYWS